MNDSTVVLKYEPLNLKAIYRRAVALHGLHRLDAALEDISTLLSMDRHNLLAVKLYARILLDRISILSRDVLKREESINECSTLLQFVSSFSAGNSSGIDSDPELREAYVKALLFRSEAYAFTDVRVPLALADADQAVKLEPSNEAAIKLRDLLQSRLRNSQKEKEQKELFAAVPPPPPEASSIAISKVTASVSDLPAPPSTCKPEIVIGADKKDSSTSSASFSSPSRPSSKGNAGSTATATPAAAAAALKIVNSPPPEASTPLHPPRTVYEYVIALSSCSVFIVFLRFERVWRSMKGQPAMFAGYLEIFKSNTFEKVIKESTSAECLSSIFQAWRDYFPNVEARLSSMKNFTKVTGFRFMLSVLPAEDLNAIRSAFDDAKQRSPEEKVNAICVLYGM